MFFCILDQRQSGSDAPSKILRKGLGEPFISAYLKLRHADWNEYAGQLTEWERRTTLDC